jgi:hypothetical protein
MDDLKDSMGAFGGGAGTCAPRRMLIGTATLTFALGGLIGILATLACFRIAGSATETDPFAVSGVTGFIAQGLFREARADLDEGDYSFFPNRRSVWVVNRTNGRMAMYQFRLDEVGSVDRSRVATLDLSAFPRDDTVILLSDRNLNNVLWVCNCRTGDVQMWYPASDGTLRSDTPVATSADLVERGR